MKAFRIAGERQFETVEIDMPKKQDDRTIVKPLTVSICGSDLHMWKLGDNYKGLIMGHEFCGVVVEPGKNSGLQIGDRVTSISYNACFECDYCRHGLTNLCDKMDIDEIGISAPGAYAEYVSVRSDSLRKVKDGVSDFEAALTEPTAVGLHAIRQARIRSGDKVLISGAGYIGLISAAWAKISGASLIVITDLNERRLDNAVKIGDIDAVLNPNDESVLEKLNSLSGNGFDCCLECSGTSSAMNLAINAVKRGGIVVEVGASMHPMDIDMLKVLLRETHIVGSSAYLHEDFEYVMDAVAKGTINVKRFCNTIMPINEIQEAFTILAGGQEPSGKIILSAEEVGK